MMNNGFDLDVVASLKESIATRKSKEKKAREDILNSAAINTSANIAARKAIKARNSSEDKEIQALEEARARAYEKHMSYFYEELVKFVKYELPIHLDGSRISIYNTKLYVSSVRLPFHKLDDNIKMDMRDFIRNVGGMILNDPRFTTMREQLLEMYIRLNFMNFEYHDEDEELEQYPDDIREQFKNGSFRFDVVIY